MSLEMEMLHLPMNYSLGRITVYPQGERQHPQLLDARGIIQVPKGAKLFLDVSQELCDNLGDIRLVPERLLASGIYFSEKNLGKANFKELRGVEPKCLVISSCNEIRIGQLLQLGELSSLEHLNLSHTPLDVSDFSWILQFPSLRTLLLSGMGADDKCLTFVVGLLHLEDLHLTQSKISDRGVQTLWKMTKLKAVNLDVCPISDEALVGIGCCLDLCFLHISDTRVSDKGIEVIVTEALRTGQQFSSLSLRSCRITDQALVRLASLRSLTLVDLFGTGVTAQGVAFLKVSLPACKILVEPEKGGGPGLWHVDGSRVV